MTNRKKYAIPSDVNSEITKTVTSAKNNIGSLNYKIIPLDRIDFDPENPRALSVNCKDIKNGISNNDEFKAKKNKEMESLAELAATIKKYGVRSPVEVYKEGDKYRLIHGERRCLSSIIAGVDSIPAKILNEKPSDFDIKILQLIENSQREDIGLYHTLLNIKTATQKYIDHVDKEASLSVGLLEKLINKSKTYCSNIYAVLESQSDLLSMIEAGKIKSLDKAAIIAKSDHDVQQRLIKKCIEGASLVQMKEAAFINRKMKKTQKKLSESQDVGKRRGKTPSKVNIGSTNNPMVVKKIIDTLLKEPEYASFRQEIKMENPFDLRECSAAIQKLIKIMESIEANKEEKIRS